MCDIADTTYLYPFTTTVVSKTTWSSKDSTAGRDKATSHPPTSVPTEGKAVNVMMCMNSGLPFNCDGCSVLGNQLYLLELFFLSVEVFPISQQAQERFPF